MIIARNIPFIVSRGDFAGKNMVKEFFRGLRSVGFAREQLQADAALQEAKSGGVCAGKPQCTNEGSLSELLEVSLLSALAEGGRSRRPFFIQEGFLNQFRASSRSVNTF